ncbi:hypothetical protein HG531_005709 [Fusarium graminearum]|nr:hypothetical protein HG531_005709 [Fusarium graminearum]
MLAGITSESDSHGDIGCTAANDGTADGWIDQVSPGNGISKYHIGFPCVLSQHMGPCTADDGGSGYTVSLGLSHGYHFGIGLENDLQKSSATKVKCESSTESFDMMGQEHAALLQTDQVKVAFCIEDKCVHFWLGCSQCSCYAESDSVRGREDILDGLFPSASDGADKLLKDGVDVVVVAVE